MVEMFHIHESNTTFDDVYKNKLCFIRNDCIVKISLLIGVSSMFLAIKKK